MIPLPTIDALDAITIPIACPVPWDEMRGDDRTRFCGQCEQHVHDVSELTRAEAVQLVTAAGKTACLRLYRRQDGRVMTADCMGRRERAWKWLHHYSPWAAALSMRLARPGWFLVSYAMTPSESVTARLIFLAASAGVSVSKMVPWPGSDLLIFRSGF